MLASCIFGDGMFLVTGNAVEFFVVLAINNAYVDIVDQALDFTFMVNNAVWNLVACCVTEIKFEALLFYLLYL